MTWRRTPQVREQRVASPLETIVGVVSYAQRLQAFAEAVIAYFTPRTDEEIKAGTRQRRREAWRHRRNATRAERTRRTRRLMAKASRRVNRG